MCDHTNQAILSFDEHENPSAVKNIKQKIQKVISRHKDSIYAVNPVLYTFKAEENKDTVIKSK